MGGSKGSCGLSGVIISYVSSILANSVNGPHHRADQPRTYSPGPAPSTGYVPLPIGGGSTRSPALAADQIAQSSHHDPAFCSAPARHVSASGGRSSPVRYHPLPPGGLTMPAM